MNEEWVLSAKVDPSFVANMQIVRELAGVLKKDLSSAARDVAASMAKGGSATEEQKEKLAELVTEIRNATKLYDQMAASVKAAKDIQIDYNAAIQQSTAAKGAYIPSGTDYMSGANPANDLANQNARLQIAQQLTAAGIEQKQIAQWMENAERAEEKAAYERLQLLKQQRDVQQQISVVKSGNLQSFMIENELQNIARAKEIAEANAARQKEIADEVVAYNKQKYAQDLAAYSANWRQKIDLDREEAAAKIANLQDEKRIHDAIEAQKNTEFDEKVNRNLRRLREEKDARLQIERELRDFQVRFADEVAARDRMQYVANTGPEASDKAQKISALRTEYQRLEKQYESLAREAANYRTEAANGSEVAARAAAKTQETLLGVEKKMKDINRQLESTHGFRGMRTMFVEGSRAAQDFLTVLSMPGMGLTEAIRAASNNLEVMAMNAGFTNAKLMMLATMMPSVIQGTMALYEWLTKESKAANAAAEAEHKRHEAFAKQVGTIKDYNDHLSKMNELRGEAKDKVNGLVEVEGKLVDLRRAEMNRETQEALIDAKNKQQEIKDRIRDARKESIEAGTKPTPRAIAAALELQAALLDAPKLPGLERNERTLRDKLLRNNEMRDAEIAKAEIDNQLRAQDEVLKKRATLEAAAVMEGFATAEGAAGRLAASTGITPKGKDQETFFNNRIKQLLNNSTEGVTAKRFSEDAEERGIGAEQRKAKTKAYLEKVVADQLGTGGFDKRIRDAEAAKSKFAREVADHLTPGGREPFQVGGRNVDKTKKELEQAVRDARESREKEKERLEKKLGIDTASSASSLEKILKGIDRLVQLAESSDAPEVAAAPARARVFGIQIRNPDIAAFAIGGA